MATTSVNNTIDIVMPTMWMVPGVAENLEAYCACEAVNRVILIDNNPNQRPEHAVFDNPKLELVCYGHNIYVNPAWNEGYLRSHADVLCILNDDITVADPIWYLMQSTDFANIDVIGVHLKGTDDNYHIDRFDDDQDRIQPLNYDRSRPIGGQAWAFGICMFVKRSSYQVIPSLYQIWYGDDYLVQQNQNIYVLMTNNITGQISGTLKQHDYAKSTINQRIKLDSENAYRFNHFHNSRDWDILKHQALDHKDIALYLDIEYTWARRNPSDINQNVHLLYDLAQRCDSIVEMGVRTGVSTRAFLRSSARLTSYDIQLNADVQLLFDMARTLGRDVKYIQADVLKINIQPCDLLFIDTWHVYPQLQRELNLHGNQAQKYIAFHDTHTFGLQGEDGRDRQGLLTAIIEFVIANPHWRFHTHRTNNNGLTVLERISTQP